MKKMIITWEDALTAWREQGVQAVPSRMLEVLIKEAQDRLDKIYTNKVKEAVLDRIDDAFAKLKKQNMTLAEFDNNINELLLWNEDNKPNDSPEDEDESPDPADMADHANDVAGER